MLRYQPATYIASSAQAGEGKPEGQALNDDDDPSLPISAVAILRHVADVMFQRSERDPARSTISSFVFYGTRVEIGIGPVGSRCIVGWINRTRIRGSCQIFESVTGTRSPAAMAQESVSLHEKEWQVSIQTDGQAARQASEAT